MNFENLKPINATPIDVDYNNMDEEGGIRLVSKDSLESIERLGIKLKEGQLVWLSDSELEYIGVIIYRRNGWVVVTINGTRKEL